VAIAKDFTARFKFPLPFGIDEMSNAADNAYAAWPERLYVIDETGHVVYRGGMGPFNYNPAEIRDWLAAKYGAVKHEAPAAQSSPSPSTGASTAPATTSASEPAPATSTK
jgi:Iodothyronine deiodinase